MDVGDATGLADHDGGRHRCDPKISACACVHIEDLFVGDPDFIDELGCAFASGIYVEAKESNLVAELSANGYSTHHATGSKAFTENIRKKAALFQKQGLCVVEKGILRLTPAGFLASNSIIGELLW